MVSQPMNGLTAEQIVNNRRKAIQYAYDNEHDVLNSHFTEFTDRDLESCKHKSLYYLAKSIEVMAKCDVVYFCLDYDMYRGCKIEHDVALAYGLEVIYEST